MNISICFETNEHCLYDVVLFNNVLVPKILCNWESGFSIPGKLSYISDYCISDLIQKDDVLVTIVTGHHFIV